MSSTLSVSTPGQLEIVISRTFNAPRRLVFEAFTQPDIVRRWLFGPPGWTMPVCEIDARVGGRYRYVWEGPQGQEMAMTGVYREVSPPERIVSAEIFDEDWTGGETLVTMVLSEHEGRTTMTQTVRYSSEEARDAALATGMADGMGMGFDRLDALMQTLPERTLH